VANALSMTIDEASRPNFRYVHALEHLRQIRAYQVATFVHAVCVAPGAIIVELLPPFHHVAFAAVFLDQPVKVIHAPAAAFGTLDTEHVELALDVTRSRGRADADQ
jgi:hypothetical protein